MAELGRIERPIAENFKEKRKLYCVPNIYPIVDATDDYYGLVEKFWNEASQQIDMLEAAGKIKKIFCESLFVQGQDAFDALEKLNKNALKIVKKRVDEGAILLPIEREEIFGPFVDWANCLSVIRTKEVFERVYEFYTECSDRRIKYIQNVIETNLSDKEAGLLIMSDEDRVRLQFPNDIEVFLVTPPSYDDILRWVRDKMRRKYE